MLLSVVIDAVCYHVLIINTCSSMYCTAVRVVWCAAGRTPFNSGGGQRSLPPAKDEMEWCGKVIGCGCVFVLAPIRKFQTQTK